MNWNALIKVYLALLFAICYKVCVAQTTFSEQNFKYLDSLENTVKTYLCNDQLAYSEKYDPNAVKNDFLLVQSMNQLFDTNTSVVQFDKILKGLKKARVAKSETLNGLIKISKIVINGNYLHIELTLEYIDDFFFRKRMMLSTITNGRCGLSAQRVLDFKLLKNAFVKYLNFLVRSRDREYLVADVLLEEKIRIAAEKYGDFIFITSADGDKGRYNSILRNQYNSDSSCCYSYSRANSYFVTLIDSGEFSLIKDLLYSPNYFYAINAMEALLYLSSINKIPITDTMKRRMDSLKAASFEITVQRSSDVFVIVSGYMELNTTNEEVIKKYRSQCFRAPATLRK